MSKVYTGGTFDLFHAGHVNFLRRCKEIAGTNGEVVVSLNTDDFVHQYKGSPPVCNEEDRVKVIAACRYVDSVVFNTGDMDSKPAIIKVNPDYIVIGSDWARKDYYTQMGFTQDWLDEHGIGLIYIPYTKGISTSFLKQKIK